ncbi:MAG: 2-oxo acid dehydrogenase subunit E2 [Erysipelotrichales bacterium]|nr:2-oxo acid dehydrogenase subunit E2 [Erysipelotrichales bacterium]
MRKFGDRKDAKRVREISGMFQIMMDLKPQRSVSDVYINQKMDVTELCKYIEKRKEKGDHITIFHAFMTGIGKVYYNRPYLNRFVANRHVYEHNDVVISFVAKVAFDDKAEEMMILTKIDPDDNLDSISKKIADKVDSIRNKKEDKKGANNAIDFLGKLPNIIRIPIVGIFKWCDKMGILPASLVEDNLYYSSLIVSNLGSIHCGAILHNITNFGTASGLATMGEIKDEEVIINGKKEIRKICEFGINLDERIADGYYFAKSIQLLQHIFDNPKMLEENADKKIEVKLR